MNNGFWIAFLWVSLFALMCVNAYTFDAQKTINESFDKRFAAVENNKNYTTSEEHINRLEDKIYLLESEILKNGCYK